MDKASITEILDIIESMIATCQSILSDPKLDPADRDRVRDDLTMYFKDRAYYTYKRANYDGLVERYGEA